MRSGDCGIDVCMRHGRNVRTAECGVALCRTIESARTDDQEIGVV